MTVPAAAVTSAVTQPMAPLLRLEPVPCTASLAGSLAAPAAGQLLPSGLPLALKEPQGTLDPEASAGGATLVVVLEGCSWRNSSLHMAYSDAATLLAGIRSEQAEAGGFNDVVAPALLPSRLSVLNATAVRLRLPELAAYDISAAETGDGDGDGDGVGGGGGDDGLGAAAARHAAVPLPVLPVRLRVLAWRGTAEDGALARVLRMLRLLARRAACVRRGGSLR